MKEYLKYIMSIISGYLIAELLISTDVKVNEFNLLSENEKASLIWRELFQKRIPVSEACQGVIGKKLEISSMDWWPMALYGLFKGTQMCLTLETSSLFDMETRISAHLTAIKTAFKHFQ